MRTITKQLGYVAAAFFATAPLSAHTQTLAQSVESGATRPDGYRVAQLADGFQLVEHGIWSKSEEATSGGEVDVLRRNQLSTYRAEKTDNHRPRGFRRAGYLPHIYAAEAQFALPTGLLDALVWTESRYNPLAVSKAGAAGLGQLMPGTAKDLGVTNRFDPLANITGAARYLRQMIDKFGMVHLALAAYNAGPRAVERARGIPRNGETPSYVRKVLRSWRF